MISHWVDAGVPDIQVVLGDAEQIFDPLNRDLTSQEMHRHVNANGGLQRRRAKTETAFK